MEIAGISVEVRRKRIRRLYLHLDPPDGRVRMSVPFGVPTEAIRRMVVDRLEWIRRHQAAMSQQHHAWAQLGVSGEWHYVEGSPYRLEVIERSGPAGLRLVNGAMRLQVPPGADAESRLRALDAWYRQRMREALPPLLRQWEVVIGCSVAECRVRRMRTRWGSCNVRARRIWLNLELMRWPRASLEYVLVHEMVHLLERDHSRRFYRLMDRFLPDWRARSEALARGLPAVPAG